MQVQPLNEQERLDVLRRYNQAIKDYNEAMDAAQWDRAATALEDANQQEQRYLTRIPRMAMGRCPFDGKPLVHTFDPYGLDGLWWQPDATPEELPTCPHVCVLRGAVHYNGLPPQAGPFEVHPGPEVPYVIPRLLDYPGMIAVISQVMMKNGYTAYPVAYFAERRPPPQELTADWPRTVYAYSTQLGERGWRLPNDPWDFDLMPWLERGKIRWCPPGSDNTVLSEAPPGACPYVDLPGTRERFIVEDDAVWTHGLPDGKTVLPLD